MGEEKEKKGVDGIRKGINSATIFFMAITWVALRSFFFRLIHDSNSLSNLLFFFLFLFNTFDLQRWKTSVQFKKFLPKWLRVSCTRHGWWCGKTDVFAQSLPHAVNHDCASVITDG